MFSWIINNLGLIINLYIYINMGFLLLTFGYAVRLHRNGRDDVIYKRMTIGEEQKETDSAQKNLAEFITYVVFGLAMIVVRGSDVIHEVNQKYEGGKNE